MVNAQEWLDKKYPEKSSNSEINSKGEKLEGELIIESFANLKKINVRDAKGITKIEINNCPNIEEILTYNNQITEIEGIDRLIELRKLDFANNQIKEMDISKNTKLVYLVCHDNPSLKEITGAENTSQLSFFNGKWLSNDKIKGTILKVALKPDEIAKKLGIGEEEMKNKTVREIREIIDEKLGEAKKAIEILQELVVGSNSENTKQLINKLKFQKYQQLIQEFKKLRIYLEENLSFRLREIIEDLIKRIGSKEKFNEEEKNLMLDLANEIISNIPVIVKTFEDEIEEGENKLDEDKKNWEEALRIVSEGKEKIFTINKVQKSFTGKDVEKEKEESLKKICKATEIELNNSKKKLEIVKEILKEIVSYQKDLDNQWLETRMEVSKK